MKKYIIIFLNIVLMSFLWWCSFFWIWEQESTQQSKDIWFYKNLWKSTFSNYQFSSYNIWYTWEFDLSMNFWLSWDIEEIKKVFSLKNVDQENILKNIWINTFWDYEITWNKIKNLWLNLKLFYNKENIWVWDLDITMNIKNNISEMYLNNLNVDFLETIWIDQQMIEYIMWYYSFNKNKKIRLNYIDMILNDILVNIENQKNPFFEVNDEQDKKIIESFLNNEVIEIQTWSIVWKDEYKMSFKLNSSNLKKFLDEVWEIIWIESNFKDDKIDKLTIYWDITIKWNIINDSNFVIELPIETIDKNWEKISDMLINEFNLKLPSLDKINFDILYKIYSYSTPSNKLIISLKWLVK